MSIDKEEMYKRFVEQLEKEQTDELEKHSREIGAMIALCQSLGFNLNSTDFDYIPTIGVIAEKEGILRQLLPDLKYDKDGLVSLQELRSMVTPSTQMPGYFLIGSFLTMAHQYFRRQFSASAAFAPRFIPEFCAKEYGESNAYIALDPNRVRINTDSRFYIEDDTWFGAPFNEAIGKISDGIAKLRPPIDLAPDSLSFLFKDAYSLDIKWSEKNGIKTFQAQEFKQSNIVISLQGLEYHPVRYVHAEYDLRSESFRHFDGAVHHYTEEEYISRRDQDLNYGVKSTVKFKPKSLKIFKLNGTFTVDLWADLCCQFLSGNPLIIEYFTGEYPASVKDMLARINDSGT